MRANNIFNVYFCLSVLLLALPLAGCKGDRKPVLTRGQLLPSVTLPMVGGGQLNIPSDLKGKINIVLFWSQGCTYCKKEMPLLKPLYEKYHDKGFEFAAVHIGPGMEESGEMKSSMALPFVMAVDGEGSLNSRYGLVAVPTMFVLDSSGALQERVLGGLPVAEIEKMIQQRIQ